MGSSKKNPGKVKKDKKKRRSQQEIVVEPPTLNNDMVKDKPDLEIFKGVFRFPEIPFWQKLIFILIICFFHLILAYILKMGIVTVIKIGSA